MGFELGLNWVLNGFEFSCKPRGEPSLLELSRGAAENRRSQFRANREESRACSSYPEVQPKIDEVNGFGKAQGVVLCTFYMAKYIQCSNLVISLTYTDILKNLFQVCHPK